jgi:GNAT superfamily N-acetyltransferase
VIVPDAWLSEQLDRPAFRVEANGVAPEAIVGTLASRSLPANAFCTAKVDALELPLVAALVAAKFAVVETTLTFERPLDSHAAVPQVALCEPRWQSHVLDIAEQAFRFSRFHLDSRIGAAAANRIKRAWIASYLAGRRGDALLVAHDGDAGVGFNAMLVSERPTGPVAVIDLFAVRPDRQQCGIGRLLIAAALHRYHSHCATLEVSTQASNIPSVRFYERMGFRLIRSGFVCHRHGNG